MIFSLALSLLTGCASPCDKAVGVMIDIKQLSANSKDKLVTSCKADYDAKPESKPDVDAMAACADMGDADKKKCAYTAMVNREVNKARASKDKDWGMAVGLCRDEIKTTIPDVCAGVVKEGLAASTAAVTALRDSGGDALMACVTLEKAAKEAGGDAPAAAKTLCDEAKGAEEGAKGMAAAKANIASKTADIPSDCMLGVKYLEDAGTDWSKAKAKEVAQVCYGDLGAVVFAADLDKDATRCGMNSMSAYEVVAKYNLTGADLDPLVAKVKPLCGS
jgi:hypothetical protein